MLDASSALALNPLDPHSLLSSFGALGVFLVLFAETGLLLGFFLPGDSLLFTAGLLASQGSLNFPVIVAGCFAAAVAGDQVGYYIGRRAGPAIFRRPDSRFFKKKNVDRAKAYFELHGSKTIVLARFIPIVRTVLNPLAGTVGVSTRAFTLWQVVGGLAWAIGVTLAGYGLGSRIPGIDRYLLPIIAVVVILSLLPVLLELRRARRVTNQT
jgi:membrane-associated protein